MLKKILVLLIFVSVLLVEDVRTQAFTYQSVNPEFPGNCWDKESDALWPFGTEYYPTGIKGKCYVLTCSEDGRIYQAGCGIISCPVGKKEFQDYSKPNPGCCPRCVDA